MGKKTDQNTFITLSGPLAVAGVRRIFRCLGKAQVRFVGGCVRNALFGVPVGDVDLATTLSPDEVIAKLEKVGIKVVPTGIDHGTVTAVLSGVGYEITTLRRDVETDGRRAVVAYTTDWAEDAARRDFTMNALYADLGGRVYDPLGTGISDLQKRKIRFVGDAETRIREDYLRILRFFRFHQFYGKGAPDKKAMAACEKYASEISRLSRERVTQEFSKILMGEGAVKTLSLMKSGRIFPVLLGRGFNPDRFGSLIKIQKMVEGASFDALFCARLFTLMGRRSVDIEKFSNVLILNRKQNSILNDLERIKMDTNRLGSIDFLKLLYLFDRASVQSALMVASARDGLSVKFFGKLWRQLDVLQKPVFPLSGKDLIAAGYDQGEVLGLELARLEKLWIKSGFCLGREELERKLFRK